VSCWPHASLSITPLGRRACRREDGCGAAVTGVHIGAPIEIGSCAAMITGTNTDAAGAVTSASQGTSR
jgi:hypothetical protein